MLKPEGEAAVMDEMELLKRAGEIVNRSAMHARGASGIKGGADWVMALNDEDGYPAASMITAARADGFNWIAFCTGAGWNKPRRAAKDPRSCVYLFDEATFTGISLVGRTEVLNDVETKRRMWFDELSDAFSGPEDESWCVMLFKPERYNIYIDNRTICGKIEK